MARKLQCRSNFGLVWFKWQCDTIGHQYRPCRPHLVHYPQFYRLLQYHLTICLIGISILAPMGQTLFFHSCPQAAQVSWISVLIWKSSSRFIYSLYCRIFVWSISDVVSKVYVSTQTYKQGRIFQDSPGRLWSHVGVCNFYDVSSSQVSQFATLTKWNTCRLAYSLVIYWNRAWSLTLYPLKYQVLLPILVILHYLSFIIHIVPCCRISSLKVLQTCSRK